MEEIREEVKTEEPVSKSSNALSILVLTVIVGIVAGISLIYGNGANEDKKVFGSPSAPMAGNAGEVKTVTVTIKSISADEHILGNFNAPIKLIVYGDLECPFCKDFHSTLRKIMEEYGPQGKVAWIYRHYVLEEIHPKALKEAEAAECAEELGGNLVFWKYVDRIFEITKSNNSLDPQELLNTANYLNFDADKFSACLDSGKYTQTIQYATLDALNAGAKGTPYTIVIQKDKGAFQVSGAVPYAKLKEMVESALK